MAGGGDYLLHDMNTYLWCKEGICICPALVLFCLVFKGTFRHDAMTTPGRCNKRGQL